MTRLRARIVAMLREERAQWIPLPDFKGILNGVGDVLNKLTFGVSGRVASLADGVWDQGSNLIQHIVDVGRNVITGTLEISGWIVQHISDIGGNVLSGALQVGASIVNGITDIGGNVLHGMLQVGASIVNGITDIGGNVLSGALQVGASIVNGVADAGGNVLSGGLQIAGSIVNGVTDAGGNVLSGALQVGASIVNGVTDIGGNVLHGMLELGGQVSGSISGVRDAVDAVPGAIGPAIGEGLKTAATDGAKGIGEFVQVEFDGLFLLLEGIIKAARDAPSGQLRQHILDEFNRGVAAIIGTGTVAPVDAPAAISDALITATEYGLVAQLFAAVSALIPTENATPLTYLANFMGRFSSYDPLIDVSVKTAIDLALARPYRHLIDYNTHTNIPSEMGLSQLVARRKISENSWGYYHQEHGYDGRWQTVMLDAAYRPLRIFELARIMAQQDIPDDQLTSMLTDAGYRDEVIAPLALALHQTATKATSTKLVTSATAAYSDGFIAAPEFGRLCSDAGVAAGEQQILMRVAELDYMIKVKGEMVSVYRARAGAGVLTDDELRAGLAGLGVTGAKADVEVARANLARLRKPVADTSAAQTKARNATRATLTTAYKDQYKMGVITAAQLQAQLVYIGIPDFQASAIVVLTQAEMLKAPAVVRGTTPAEVAARVQRDLEAAYVTQYGRGAIDDATLRTQLVAIGLDPAEAEAIVAKEHAKQIPKPAVVKATTPELVAKQVADTLARAYEEQYKKGQISADELEQDFVAIGLDPAVAQARRLLDEARVATKTTPTAPAASASG